jgi:hypothetical protein
MSAAVAFDTLKFVRKLEAGGFTQAQATAAAEAFAEATSQELATKSDLRDVEVRLEAKIEKLEAKIGTSAANLKVDILRRLVVTQLALAGVVFAAFKFAK